MSHPVCCDEPPSRGANFAAIARGMGLLAWLLLLAAQLLMLLEPIARRDRPIVRGAILLATGQFTLGVSTATFGILLQTMIYAVRLGYLFCRARHLATDAEAETGVAKASRTTK